MFKLFSKQAQNPSANYQVRVQTMKSQKEERLMSKEFNLPLVTILKCPQQVETQQQVKKLTANSNFSAKLQNQQLLFENPESIDAQKFTRKTNTEGNSFDYYNNKKLSHQTQESTEKIKTRQLSLQIHKEKELDFRKTQLSRNNYAKKFQHDGLTNDDEPLEVSELSNISYITLQQNFEKFQHNQGKTQVIKENKLLNNDFQMRHSRKAKIFQIRKIKRVFYCVFFAIALLLQLKYSNKKEFAQLQIKLRKCEQQTKKCGIKNFLYQKKQFVQFLAAKIIHQIQNSNYQIFCETLKKQLSVDFRKTNIINFSKQLYQNIELATRKQYFPQLLLNEMMINLFSNSKRKTSHFVGKRCYFYSSSKTKIPIKQRQAISLEYLLFEVIAPNLLQLIQDLELQTLNTKSEVLNNLLSIVSLMQKQFIQKFQSLPKIKFPNANMIYRKFNLLQLDDDIIAFEIKENNEVGNENLIIEGLIDFETLSKLEREKPFWKMQMEQLFEKILENILKIIDF